MQTTQAEAVPIANPKSVMASRTLIENLTWVMETVNQMENQGDSIPVKNKPAVLLLALLL